MEKRDKPLREIIKIMVFSLTIGIIFILSMVLIPKLNLKIFEKKTNSNFNYNVPQQNINKQDESYIVQPFLKSTKYIYKSEDYNAICIYDRRYTPIQGYTIEYAILELDLENNIAIAYHDFIVNQKILSIDYNIYSYLFEKRKLDGPNSISENAEKAFIAEMVNRNKPSDFAMITTDKGQIFIFKPESNNEGQYSIVFDYKDFCIGQRLNVMYLHSLGLVEDYY